MGSTTRGELHRIGAHVLGRRRYAVSGHFGLRASPGGISTPAFGPEPETLRLTPACLVREVGPVSRGLALAGATLSSLAAFAGADLDAEFSAGGDMPALGAADELLELDGQELAGLFAWFDLGSRVLDEVLAERTASCVSSTIQLWPEHFDVGTALEFGTGDGGGANLGFSPGDGFCDDPYVYVGPRGPARPGPSSFWNAPFGACRPAEEFGGFGALVAFWSAGLDRISST